MNKAEVKTLTKENTLVTEMIKKHTIRSFSEKKSMNTFEDIGGFALTRFIALTKIDGKDNGDHSYSHGATTSPLSLIKSNVKATDKLVSPLYLSEEYIKTHYNIHKYIQTEKIYKQIFALNKNHELVLQDKKIIEKQTGILKDVIKQAGIMIFTGQNVVRMSLPIKIFQPKSHLERLGSTLTNLNSLKLASEQKEPIEIMKPCISYLIGSLYYALDIQKPFNPFLGETIQGYYEDGTSYYAEHLLHDPPIDAILFENKKYNFKVYGNLETVAKIGTNEIKIQFDGLITIEVNGETIYFTFPTIINGGLIFGKRRFSFNNQMVVYYPSKDLKAIIHFGTEDKKDIIKGEIYRAREKYNIMDKDLQSKLFPKNGKKENKEDSLSLISGSWINNIQFDNKVYWDTSFKGFSLKMNLDVLPSDWRFREDLLWLLYENVTYAQSWKTKLEDVQREYRKKRTDHLKILSKKK
mgnify:CR=1 FL=1